MEIERKYLIDASALPENLAAFPFHEIEQAYLCTDPVIRVRREDSRYYMTCKGKGLMVREELNFPLNEAAYSHLLKKIDGLILTKRRYLIPLKEPYAHLTAEVDVFSGLYQGLVLAEVEFPTQEEALAFVPPAWFGQDVTMSTQYHNSSLSFNPKNAGA